MAERSKVGDEKRQPVNVKVQPALRARLEAAAALSNRSLSSEIERRLIDSFEDTDPVSDDTTPRTAQFLTCIRETISDAENRPARYRVASDAPVRQWTEDKEIRIYARRGILELVRWFMGVDESEKSAQLQRTDGSTVEDFDYGRALAWSTLQRHGEIHQALPPPVIKRAAKT